MTGNLKNLSIITIPPALSGNRVSPTAIVGTPPTTDREQVRVNPWVSQKIALVSPPPESQVFTESPFLTLRIESIRASGITGLLVLLLK